MSATDRLTADVVASFDATPDPRLRALLQGLVRHLHALLAENAVTHREWEAAVGFLTDTGQASTDVRQEVVLLSDVLGVSMLVELLGEGEAPGAATESTVLGPFHMTGSPRRLLGASLDDVKEARALVVHGRLRSSDGNMPAGATLDVWQADGEGFYDVQVPDRQPAGNGRGLFEVGPDGAFWFTTVEPAPYPLPVDGPVGRLLHASRRHPYRPAHIHVIASAPGHRDVTTHVFIGGSPYLDTDAVFAVRESLVVDAAPSDDRDLAALCDVPVPFRSIRVDLMLARTDPAPDGRA